MPNADVRRSFAIVTPVLNGAAYVRKSVESVIAQGPEGVDYLVVDGGSTDDTLALLRAGGPQLRVLERPGNQAEAINYGVQNTKGAIVAIVNADDWLLPGALDTVHEAFERNPSAAVVYGRALFGNERDGIVGEYPVEPFSRQRLQRGCMIAQPAAFVRRNAFEAIGGMNDTNLLTCDYELWLRLSARYPVVFVDRLLAVSREHAGNKSSRRRREMLRETIRMLRRECGYVSYTWIIAYAKDLIAGDDRPGSGPKLAAALLSLPIGVVVNRGAVARYVLEWASYRRLGSFLAAAERHRSGGKDLRGDAT